MERRYTLRHDGKEAALDLFSARALIRAKLTRLQPCSEGGTRVMVFRDDVEKRSCERVFLAAQSGTPLRFRVEAESRDQGGVGSFDAQLIFGGKRKTTTREMLYSVDWDCSRRRVDYRTEDIGGRQMRIRSGNRAIRHTPWQGPPPVAYIQDRFAGQYAS